MKKVIFIALLFCFITTINAQGNRQGRNARIESMRVAFITEKLELTVEEAQLFWPIFNEYEAERKKIKKSHDRKKDINSMTDAEADAFVQQSFINEQKILDLKRTYFERFKTAISVKKIARLSRVEKSFRQELLKRMKQRRDGQNRGDKRGS